MKPLLQRLENDLNAKSNHVHFISHKVKCHHLCEVQHPTWDTTQTKLVVYNSAPLGRNS